MPNHTHVQVDLGVTPSGGTGTQGDIAADLDGQPLNMPFENYQWYGATRIQHTSLSATLSVTGTGFEDADEDWTIDWSYLSVFTPVVSITGGGMVAENSSSEVSFTVSRDGNSAVWDVPLTIGLEWSGDAKSMDFEGSRPTSVTIPAGQQSKTFTVTPHDDTKYEPNEQATVMLKTGDNYEIGTPDSAGVTIVSDDLKPIVSIANVSNGSESGPVDGAFVLTRTNDIDQSLKVNLTYDTEGSRAVAWADFALPVPSVTFAAGETSRTLPVQVSDDRFIDPGDIITATISQSGAYDIATAEATVTIADNDSGAIIEPPQEETGGGAGDEEDDGTDEEHDAWVDLSLGYQGWFGHPYWWGSADPEEQHYGSTDAGDGLTTGAFLRLNSDFDETTEWDGTSALQRDNEKSGIVPFDGEVFPMWAGMWTDQADENDEWTITWDESKAKLWAPDYDENGQFLGTYTQQSSGWSGTVEDDVYSHAWWHYHVVTAFVEPIGESTTIDDATFTATFNPVNASQVKDQVKATVVDVDIDVDSDNDHELQLNEVEDYVENVFGNDDRPGKTILIAEGDADNDGVPDFADGFDRFDYIDEDNINTGVELTELVFATNSLVTDKAQVHIDYSNAANPSDVDWTTTAPYVAQGNGSLRLWLTETPETRDGRPFAEGGDFIAPGEYALSDLDPDGDGEIQFWVESVRLSQYVADQHLSVSVKPTEDAPYLMSDTVRFTSTAIRLFARDLENEEFIRTYHIVGSALPGILDETHTSGTYAVYKMQILDPRTTGLTETTVGDETIPLSHLGYGVHESAEFVVLETGASPGNHAYAVVSDESEIEVSYNPRKKIFKVRAQHLTDDLKTLEIIAAEKHVEQIDDALKADYSANGANSWIKNYSSADSGAYGKELHKRFTDWIKSQNQQTTRWMHNVYVDVNTKKVLHVGDNPPGNVTNNTNVQQIDAVCMNNSDDRFEIGDDWNLAQIQSVHELKSGGGLSGNQRTRYLELTDGGNKLFTHVSKYRWKPGSGIVNNNHHTVITKVYARLGLALDGTVAVGVIKGAFLAQFDEVMAKADQAVVWNAKMANPNATQNDKDTYPHKVSEFMREMNEYTNMLVPPIWDIDGAVIAEKFIIEQMYLQWVSP